jgi:hypothetical protein
MANPYTYIHTYIHFWPEIVTPEAKGEEVSLFNLAATTIVPSTIFLQRTNRLNVPKIRNHASRNLPSVGADSEK